MSILSLRNIHTNVTYFYQQLQLFVSYYHIVCNAVVLAAATICPRPSPPSLRAAEPTAAPADGNVAVYFPTVNTFPRSLLQLSDV